jgi:LPXTG-motif cell wall-anchored protein
MRKKLAIFISLFYFLGVFLLWSTPTYALELSVEAPGDVLTQGQVFDFKVNIDTQGESVSKQEFLVTYDTRYVEFQDGGFLAGDFFDSVSYNKLEDGKLYVLAESTTPKSGTGLIAIVKLKIVATAPGSTNICAATPIEATPTPVPTTPVSVPTTPPTALPKTGSENNILVYSLFGISFIGMSLLIRRML